MKGHKAFIEKFYRANVGKPSKCQNIHDSFRVWLVNSSFIKFLNGYYLISILHHNAIFD